MNNQRTILISANLIRYRDESTLSEDYFHRGNFDKEQRKRLHKYSGSIVLTSFPCVAIATY